MYLDISNIIEGKYILYNSLVLSILLYMSSIIAFGENL